MCSRSRRTPLKNNRFAGKATLPPKRHAPHGPDRAQAMQEWRNRIGDMLAYVNDKLVPQGFDEIVKDDFTVLRQMLSGRIRLSH
jgi:hypothetical protein